MTRIARVNERSLAIGSSPLGLGGTTAMPALDDISDVDLTGIADGDTLVWDDATDTWIPGAGGSGLFLEVVGGGKGTVAALGNLGATETINVAAANYHWGTLNANCTIGFTGWTSGKDSQITVELIEDGSGGWTPTFSGVTWLGGTTPTHDTTLGTTTIYVFFSRDGGTTIVGGQLGAGGALDPDDVRDAGRWEVAMVPGITAPPEPVETPDGTDWVYGWVT